MNNDKKLGSKDLPEHDPAEGEKLGRSAEDKTKADLLTNTPGSPRVPSQQEMAKSPKADGQDGRIGLKENQKPKDTADTQKK